MLINKTLKNRVLLLVGIVTSFMPESVFAGGNDHSPQLIFDDPVTLLIVGGFLLMCTFLVLLFSNKIPLFS